MDVFNLVAKITLDTSEYNRNLEEAGQKSSVFGDILKANLVTKGIDLAIKGFEKLGQTAVGFVKDAVSSYGQYQQLTGGVETLFGDSADKVKKYAEDAYKTAGMSANKYMETVTGFSASLIQATGRGVQTDIDELEETLKQSAEETKLQLEDEYDAIKKAWDERIKTVQNESKAEAEILKQQRDEELKGLSKSKNKDEYNAIKKAWDDRIKEAQNRGKEESDALKKQKEEELKALKRANKDQLAQLKAHNKDVIKEAEAANNASVTTAESLSVAADVANMAIIDMSDNANKMGTNIDSLMNAYQGFAKQNYTMLDNLKLGYGGTKDEMERLLEDAEKFSGIHYDVSNLADVYNAIHVVQEEMGITGTTAKEAGETIEGSVGSMKAAWENLVTGMGDKNADLQQLVDDLLVSAEGAFNNVFPIIQTVIENIASNLPTILDKASEVAGKIAGVVLDHLPELLTAGLSLAGNIAQGIANGAATLVEKTKELLKSLNEWLSEPKNLHDLVDRGGELVGQIVDGITAGLGQLLEAATSVINTFVDDLFVPENENDPNSKTLIEKGAAILGRIIDGIASALKNLVTAAGDIILNLVNNLKEPKNWDKIFNAGADILNHLIEGIGSLILTLGEKAKEIADTIYHALTDYRNWVEAGKWIAEKVWEGFTTGNPLLQFLIGPAGLGNYAPNSLVGQFEGMTPEEAQKYLEDLGNKQTNIPSKEEVYQLPETWQNNIVKQAYEEINGGSLDSYTQSVGSVTEISGSSSVAESLQEVAGQLQFLVNNGLNVNDRVELQGDAAQLFTVIRRENETWRQAYGYGL